MTYNINKINKLTAIQHLIIEAETEKRIKEKFLRGELDTSIQDINDLEEQIKALRELMDREANQ
jgi:flagellar motility protein MotE (MotC chaperone)